MKSFYLTILLLAVSFIYSFSAVSAQVSDGETIDFFEEEVDEEVVYDPLEPLNRVFFEFNDKLYFWVLKPVKNGYSAVLPEDIRYIIGNFFYNLASPIRLVNNILQGKFSDAGVVISRFAINSTVGVFGLGDPAQREFHLDPKPADFGQTLGMYSVAEGIYFCWPVLGPSNLRDTVGLVADIYIHPLVYVDTNTTEKILYYSVDKINKLSLNPAIYEDVKKYSLDPYIAMRHAYYEYRNHLIEPSKELDDWTGN